jgi:hypothetical protein
MFEQDFSFKDEEVIFSKNLMAREKLKKKLMQESENQDFSIKNKEFYYYKR